MRRLRQWLTVFSAVAMVLTFSSIVVAQVDTGTIAGTVKDQSGAVMPGVTITLTNEDTGTSQTTVTNERGSFQFPALRSGTYSITGVLEGFRKFQQQRVSLSIQQRLVIDMAMEIGGLEDLVTVTAEGQILQTQDASIGAVIKSAEIESLALRVAELYVPGAIESGRDSRCPGWPRAWRGGVLQRQWPVHEPEQLHAGWGWTTTPTCRTS